jgi:anti-sigma factor RsiW
MNTVPASRHEEVWLLLPWLANGRLTNAQRAEVDSHLRECEACRREADTQRHVAAILTGPERVTYAPGPSLRKLMERIDAQGSAPAAPRLRSVRRGVTATWRPPGLAWAATFALALGLGLLSATAYRWTQPLYATYTAGTAAPVQVLHIAFERTLPVGDVEEALRAAGARVVAGPDNRGIFGVAPLEAAAGGDPGAPMRTLATRLRSDPRVRWVEPLAGTLPGTEAQGTRP